MPYIYIYICHSLHLNCFPWVRLPGFCPAQTTMAQDIQAALAASSSLGAGGEEEAEDELKASGIKSFSSILSLLPFFPAYFPTGFFPILSIFSSPIFLPTASPIFFPEYLLVCLIGFLHWVRWCVMCHGHPPGCGKHILHGINGIQTYVHISIYLYAHICVDIDTDMDISEWCGGHPYKLRVWTNIPEDAYLTSSLDHYTYSPAGQLPWLANGAGSLCTASAKGSRRGTGLMRQMSEMALSTCLTVVSDFWVVSYKHDTRVTILQL